MNDPGRDLTPGVAGSGADAESGTTAASEDTARIEAEIAQTRSEMRETISAIQDRLAPANVLQRAKETARDATVGRAKQMAHELGHRASSMTTSAYDSAAPRVRDNSMPLALIGLGVGWLVARNWSGSRSSSPMVGTDWSDNPWVEDEWDNNTRTIRSATDDAHPSERGTASEMREAVSRRAEDVRDAASASAQRMRAAAAQSAERVSIAARRTQSGLEKALRDNPLAVGLATLAAGLAVGAMLPRTEVEDEYLGSTRDSVVEKARETAQSAMQSVSGTGAGSQRPQSTGTTMPHGSGTY